MKTIVWDLDDVLNDFTVAWLSGGWKLAHPECPVAYEALRSNPPLVELKATRAEYLKSLDHFRLSQAAQHLKPQPQILDWFQTHGAEFNHHILTARPTATVAPAAAWAFQHFGKWIRHFHFVPSARSSDVIVTHEKNKAEVLRNIGDVAFFIDDSSENIADAEELGIRSILFPQPWNDSTDSVDSILAQLACNQIPALK